MFVAKNTSLLHANIYGKKRLFLVVRKSIYNFNWSIWEEKTERLKIFNSFSATGFSECSWYYTWKRKIAVVLKTSYNVKIEDIECEQKTPVWIIYNIYGNKFI